MDQSSEVKDLFAALSKAQAKLKGAKKDSTNPFFQSAYADLESVWEAVRAPLADNGLCVIQTTAIISEELYLVTTLGHLSGQWIRSLTPILMIKKDAQSMGSAISYARRYALAALVGVYQTDDDGEGAMSRQPQAPSASRPAVKPPVTRTAPVSSVSPSMPMGR